MADEKRPVVIIGGGFAGVDAARHLRRRMPRETEIILFSRENHFVFTPLLADALGSSINPLHVVRPIRQMARGVACRTAAVTRIDWARRELTAETADTRTVTQAFGPLVIACGSVIRLDLVPGMAAHSWPVKTLGDILMLRNRLIGQLEAAEVEPDPELKRRRLSFLVVGGGFSGAEVAGEIADLLTASCKFYSRIRPEEIRVTILESKDRIMSQLPESLSAFALRKMRARGIDARLGVRVQSVTERGVRLQSGEEIEAGTIIGTIGNTVNPLIRAAGLPLVQDRVPTRPDLSVEGFDDVWALGDCAAVPNELDGAVCPATAQFAVRQAKHLAQNLLRARRGEATRPFRFKALGELASIGHRNAVGEVFGIRLSGFPAWFVWRGVYLSKMPTLARKIQVAFDWAWELFFPRDIAQLDLAPTERLGREHFEPGQFVFRRGDFGDKFYMIERGRAGRYLDDAWTPVATLGPGEHFGELSLLDASRRQTSIRAEEPLDVLTIDRHSFARLTGNLDSLRRSLEGSARRIKASQEFMAFVKDHPKLAALSARDVMSRPAATLASTLSLADAVRRVRESGRSGYPVVDGQGRLAGIFTRTDLGRALIDLKPPETPLSSLMKKPVIAVKESAPLSEAVLTFIREPIQHLVVVSDGDPTRPAGMLTPFDLLQVALSK